MILQYMHESMLSSSSDESLGEVDEEALSYETTKK